MSVKAAASFASTDIRHLLDSIFADAIGHGASDIHVEPTLDACEIRFREDGMLLTALILPSDAGRSIALRLMVLANLLTYRLDVPQEGRASFHHHDREIELRISIMPTIHGLRAAVRLPAAMAPRELEQLGLDHAILENLRRFARADTGMLIVTGPAGSGKTTTIYALLAHLAACSQGMSIVALEDPVERAIPGVTQIEVKPFGQLTYEKALRSILRQDPQILMLGEIRDAATAQLAVQAAMTGHRLITTLHASTAAGAVSRLLEMGLEPYQVTSALWAVLAQRLIRKSSSLPLYSGGGLGWGQDQVASCELRVASEHPPLPSPKVPGERTMPTYRGRTAIGELLIMDTPLRNIILDHPDMARLAESALAQAGFVPLRSAARQLVEKGVTDCAELIRIFGDEELP